MFFPSKKRRGTADDCVGFSATCAYATARLDLFDRIDLGTHAYHRPTVRRPRASHGANLRVSRCKPPTQLRFFGFFQMLMRDEKTPKDEVDKSRARTISPTPLLTAFIVGPASIVS